MAVSAPTVIISEIEATAVISEVEASTVVTEVGTSVVATEIDASAVMTEVEATVAITEVEATAVISEIEATAVITEVEASAVITEVETSATIFSIQISSNDNIVINGSFDTDITGWVKGSFTTPDPTWSASGGGFTGSIHSEHATDEAGVKIDINNTPLVVLKGRVYYFSCDVNVITNSGGNLYVYLGSIADPIFATVSDLGLTTISGLYDFPVGGGIEIVMLDSGAKEFYADNVLLAPVESRDISAPYGVLTAITEVGTTVIITE